MWGARFVGMGAGVGYGYGVLGMVLVMGLWGCVLGVRYWGCVLGMGCWGWFWVWGSGVLGVVVGFWLICAFMDDHIGPLLDVRYPYM